jgi:hypothetical protein
MQLTDSSTLFARAECIQSALPRADAGSELAKQRVFAIHTCNTSNNLRVSNKLADSPAKRVRLSRGEELAVLSAERYLSRRETLSRPRDRKPEQFESAREYFSLQQLHSAATGGDGQI